MCLVEDHVIPRLPLEDVRVSTGQGIRGDTNVEVVFIVPALSQFLTTLGVAVIAENFETREKFLELHFPIQEHTGWDDDKMGSPNTAVAGEMRQERDSLDCFAM